MLPAADLRPGPPLRRGGGPPRRGLRRRQPLARARPAGAVVAAAAGRAAGDAADEAVAEHRLPGRRPQDRLQGHGRARPRKPTVSETSDRLLIVRMLGYL